jgi:hypothetical protein
MNRTQDANDGGVPSTSSALRGVHHIVGLPIAAIAFHRPCARPNLTGQPKTTHRARLALQIQNRNAVGDTANCRMSFAGGLSIRQPPSSHQESIAAPGTTLFAAMELYILSNLHGSTYMAAVVHSWVRTDWVSWVLVQGIQGGAHVGWRVVPESSE